MPGSVLRDLVVDQLEIRQADLADATGLSRVHINHLLTGKSPITPKVALRLARVTSTDAAYWLGLQSAFELYWQEKRLRATLESLPVLTDSETGSRRRHRTPWSTKEIDQTKGMLASGASIAEVSVALGRTYGAVSKVSRRLRGWKKD
jgi:addiction module HigA family antidote